MTTENSLIDSALRGWKSNVERADKLFGSLSPRELEQVGSGNGLGAIAQNRVARDQPEAVGRLFAVLGIGLDGAAHCGVGRGFRAGTASESIHGAARKNGAPRLSRGSGDLGAAKSIVSRVERSRRLAAITAEPIHLAMFRQF